jgi:hypothetical protein
MALSVHWCSAGRCALWLLASVAPGCTQTIDLDPLDESAVVEARVRPPAITGGTLALVGEAGA